MKVTYIYPPLFKSFYPIATRIITENLLRDKNLEVEFSDVPVRVYPSGVQEEIFERIMSEAVSRLSPNEVTFLEQKYIIYNLFYIFMAHGYFDEYILGDVDSNYVIVSVINFCDLLIVRPLLERNKRVVIGGPLINIGLSSTFIRQFLLRMGTDPSRLRDDMIILSGNMDLRTDLYRMIKDWRDAAISENQYGTIFECERDFLSQYSDGLPSTPVHLGFSNRCWYGKCRFCTYKGLPEMDLLTNVQETQVIRNIRKLMSSFNSTHIRFIDSYFNTTTPRVQHILDQISDYDITVYSGITMLKRRGYIEFINKYVNCLLIGLESTSDFSLKCVNKGYTYEDITEAINNVVSYLDKGVFLEISVIADLPAKNREDVQANYRNIFEIKNRLENQGFRVGLHLNILSVFPNLELLYVKDPLLKHSYDPSQMALSTGKSYLISLLRKSGMDNPPQLPSGSVLVDTHTPNLQYGYVSSDVPILRYDVDGNLLPSDLNLIDEDILKGVLERTSRKS
jgi:hypothetical protein